MVEGLPRGTQVCIFNSASASDRIYLSFREINFGTQQVDSVSPNLQRREGAASHISRYWTVYQRLIKLGQSFQVPLNYTQRKCWYVQNARAALEIASL